MARMITTEIEVAIMGHYGIQQNTIVPNAMWGAKILHECDLLIISQSGYATEVEIKVSKADLLKDKEKMHGHIDNKIKYFYFAVPKSLEEVALREVPERAGLYVVERKIHNFNPLHYYDAEKHFGKIYYSVTEVRKAKQSKHPYKWSEEEINNLRRLAAMRVFSLKKKIVRLTNQCKIGNRKNKIDTEVLSAMLSQMIKDARNLTEYDKLIRKYAKIILKRVR